MQSRLFILTFLTLVAVPGRAQSTPPTDVAYLLRTHTVDSSSVFVSATRQPKKADSADSVPPASDTTEADDDWHFAVTPYLWFPGMHGTATGPRGGSLSFRASPGDLLSNFRFGLMGAFEASRKRLVLSGDLMWVRLEDDKAVPFPGLLATSASMKASEFFLTPKVGIRVIDQERIKVIAQTGFRYWHLGESLKFNPSSLGLSFSGSQDFVDPVVGGRIEASLSPKIVVILLGDVGGWGTGSELEYQWAGSLGYKIKPKWVLLSGYRYLFVDKRGGRGFVFNSTSAGVAFGVTINLK